MGKTGKNSKGQKRAQPYDVQNRQQKQKYAPNRDIDAPNRDTNAPNRDMGAANRDTNAANRDTNAPNRDTGNRESSTSRNGDCACCYCTCCSNNSCSSASYSNSSSSSNCSSNCSSRKSPINWLNCNSCRTASNRNSSSNSSSSNNSSNRSSQQCPINWLNCNSCRSASNKNNSNSGSNSSSNRSSQKSPINWLEFTTDKRLRNMCQSRNIPIIPDDTFRECFELGEKEPLGEGAYGACVKLTLDDDRQYAVKKFFNGDGEALGNLKREVRMLQLAQGRGVQRLVGVCAGYRTLVTEYGGPSAADFRFRSHYERVSVLDQVMRTARRTLKRKICHNDIRPANVCVKRRRLGEVDATLIDFGVASGLGDKPGFGSCSGEDDYPWMAPELKSKKGKATVKSEVYSLGRLADGLVIEELRDDYFDQIWPLERWVQRATHDEKDKRPTLEKGIVRTVQFLETLRPGKRKRSDDC